MMRIRIIFSLVMVFAAAAYGQRVGITGPDRSGMLEGESYKVTWTSSGIKSVSAVATGRKTTLGTQSRGNLRIVISDPVPAGQGEIEWIVPWIDTANFNIKLKGFDKTGRAVAANERDYNFRPKALANRMEDGLYLDLSAKTKQRLYIQRNYRITNAYLSSSSRNYLWNPPGRHIQTPHDHAGVFSIIEKKPMHWSSLFNVRMPWAMRYHGGHFVHATSRNLYKDLGTPASAGCNRLTNHDAREVYRRTPLGTRIEVIGPDG